MNQQIRLTDVFIVILLMIILLQRFGHGSDPIEPKVIRDTVWVHHDSTINSKPQMVGTVTVPIDRWNTEYLPDTNYTKLLAQYMDVTNRFLASNFHVDSLKIDSVGYVHVKDTVSHNMITGRSYTYNLKYPIIKETIIVPEKKHNQFYIGGMVQGNSTVPVQQIGAGLLLKNKKDQIYGVSAGINKDGQVLYGVQSFWKIKLK